MSTHTEEVPHVGATTMTFAKVWIVLLILTGAEVLLAYEQVPTMIMLTILVGLSVIKAALIVSSISVKADVVLPDVCELVTFFSPAFWT